jgi:citrate lyase beta subunit
MVLGIRRIRHCRPAGQPLQPAVMQIADTARACLRACVHGRYEDIRCDELLRHEDQEKAAGAAGGLSGKLLTSSAPFPLRASR